MTRAKDAFRSLRHDLAMIGRAAAVPLPERFRLRLGSSLARISATASDYLEASAATLVRTAPPRRSMPSKPRSTGHNVPRDASWPARIVARLVGRCGGDFVNALLTFPSSSTCCSASAVRQSPRLGRGLGFRFAPSFSQPRGPGRATTAVGRPPDWTLCWDSFAGGRCSTPWSYSRPLAIQNGPTMYLPPASLSESRLTARS